MIKYIITFSLCFLLADFSIAGNSVNNDPVPAVKTGAPVPVARLIIPGKSIGLSTLNAKGTVLHKRLGEASMDDAAMGGKDIATWYSKPVVKNGDTVINETNIYFTTPGFGTKNASQRAGIIRVTSPYFVTKNGIGTGSMLSDVLKYFPKAKRSASCVSSKTKQEVLIYDDAAAGIAFEIDGHQQCTGITIYNPGGFFMVIYHALFENVTEPASAFVSALKISAADNGKTFQLQANDNFEAIFRECVGCRDTWKITKIDKEKIEFLENTYSNKSCQDCTGGNQDNSFHLRVIKPGRSVLAFSYFGTMVSITLEAN